MSGEREQNWYPIGKVGWFTQHIREGIEVTAEQLTPLQPALAQPYRLDDATVARIIRVNRPGRRSGAIPEPGRRVDRTWAYLGPARHRPGV